MEWWRNLEVGRSFSLTAGSFPQLAKTILEGCSFSQTFESLWHLLKSEERKDSLLLKRSLMK
jgi:hypothetical protein